MDRIRNYNAQVANYTLNILKFFQTVKPFKREFDGYKWWEVEYDEKNLYKGFLPFYDYIINRNYPYPYITKATTCQSLIKKYDHYIFGIVEEGEDIKYYVYGIPGKFTMAEQPYRGTTGFSTWLESRRWQKRDIGYWLLHIDPLTGKIATPLSPTKPRR